jgi:hypothetical protein
MEEKQQRSISCISDKIKKNTLETDRYHIQFITQFRNQEIFESKNRKLNFLCVSLLPL